MPIYSKTQRSLGWDILQAARAVAHKVAESQQCTLLGSPVWTIPLVDWRGKVTFQAFHILSGRAVSPITIDVRPTENQNRKELEFRPNCGGSAVVVMDISIPWNAAEQSRVESARNSQGLLVSAAVHLNALRKAGRSVQDNLNAGEIIILQQHGFDLSE